MGSNYSVKCGLKHIDVSPNLGMSLKIPELYKSGSRIRTHSRIATSNS